MIFELSVRADKIFKMEIKMPVFFQPIFRAYISLENPELKDNFCH